MNIIVCSFYLFWYSHRAFAIFFMIDLLNISCLLIVVSFKSREDHRKQLELEEARKAGLAPAEVDEDGNEINPHIPQYMSSAPWYLNAERPVSCISRLCVSSICLHQGYYNLSQDHDWCLILY